MLGITDSKTALDVAIGSATGRTLVNAAGRADTAAEHAAATISQLRRQISQLETELGAVVEAVDDLQRQVDERDREIAKLRHMVHVDNAPLTGVNRLQACTHGSAAGAGHI